MAFVRGKVNKIFIYFMLELVKALFDKKLHQKRH